MLTHVSPFVSALTLTILCLLTIGFLYAKWVRSRNGIFIGLGVVLILILLTLLTPWPANLFTHPSTIALRASLALTILILLPGGFLSERWRRSPKRIFALGLVLMLVMFTLWTDWPSDPFSRRVLWQEHALMAGTLVSLLLLPSLYLFLDVSLEEARKARDTTCIDQIQEGIQHDESQFWAKFGDLGSNSSGVSLLKDLSYAKEESLAVQRTVAVWAQLTMHLQSREGMAMAKDAIRTFGALGQYIAALEQTITRLEPKVGPDTPKRAALDKAQQARLQRAHSEVVDCYADLVEATGGESTIRTAKRDASPP